jgi:hypothetical protein
MRRRSSLVSGTTWVIVASRSSPCPRSRMRKTCSNQRHRCPVRGHGYGIPAAAGSSLPMYDCAAFFVPLEAQVNGGRRELLQSRNCKPNTERGKSYVAAGQWRTVDCFATVTATDPPAPRGVGLVGLVFSEARQAG